LAELDATLGRVAGGASELVLVSGAAGVGKSALVEQLREKVAARNGRFASGKFDARRSNTPFASVVDALRGLILGLSEQPDAAAATQRRLSEALGPNGGVLTEVIPELGKLIGPQPLVPPLGPTETENRFNLAFQAFLSALATREQPLVLF